MFLQFFQEQSQAVSLAPFWTSRGDIGSQWEGLTDDGTHIYVRSSFGFGLEITTQQEMVSANEFGAVLGGSTIAVVRARETSGPRPKFVASEIAELLLRLGLSLAVDDPRV